MDGDFDAGYVGIGFKSAIQRDGYMPISRKVLSVSVISLFAMNVMAMTFLSALRSKNMKAKHGFGG